MLCALNLTEAQWFSSPMTRSGTRLWREIVAINGTPPTARSGDVHVAPTDTLSPGHKKSPGPQQELSVFSRSH